MASGRKPYDTFPRTLVFQPALRPSTRLWRQTNNNSNSKNNETIAKMKERKEVRLGYCERAKQQQPIIAKMKARKNVRLGSCTRAT